MGVVSVAGVHDCVVMLISLAAFHVLGNFYLYGQSLYGLGKFHDHHNPNLLSRASNLVFIVTLMTCCAVLEIFTFELVGYLQPEFRLWVWTVLLPVLGMLMSVVIPALLGVALLCSDEDSDGLCGSYNDSDNGNDSDSSSEAIYSGSEAAASTTHHVNNSHSVSTSTTTRTSTSRSTAPSGAVWGGSWYIYLFFFLWRQLLSVRYSCWVAGVAGVGCWWWLLVTVGKAVCFFTPPSQLPFASFSGLCPPLHLGAGVLLGTALAAVLGGFAAVHFPLDVHLVAKYAGQLSQQDLATGEAHLRSSLAVATRRRRLLCPQPPTSASASDTASSTRYNNNNNNNNNSSSSSSSSGSGGGGVFRRHVPASPSKHLHSQKECSPYSSSAATAVATASELTVLSQVCEELRADLQVVLRLRAQAGPGRQHSLLGRAERLYGLALSLWGLVRVCIGVCRVFWWLVPVVFSKNNIGKNYTHTLTSMDIDIDAGEENSVFGDNFAAALLPSPSLLFVLAVVGMAVLQLKAFLQTLYLMGTLGLFWRRTAPYSLLLALAACCYFLACPLFLHAFARTLTPLLGLSLGLAGKHEGAAAALSILLGSDINFDLLFRLFDMMFVCSTLLCLAFLSISFQCKISSIDSLLTKNSTSSTASHSHSWTTEGGGGSSSKLVDWAWGRGSGRGWGRGDKSGYHDESGGESAYHSDQLYPV